jgi:hypothetical protein
MWTRHDTHLVLPVISDWLAAGNDCTYATPLQVRTTTPAPAPLGGWDWQTVAASSIPTTGGLVGAAALAMACCDTRGLPVLAYTRRPSMYESYLAYAILQLPNTTTVQVA